MLVVQICMWSSWFNSQNIRLMFRLRVRNVAFGTNLKTDSPFSGFLASSVEEIVFPKRRYGFSQKLYGPLITVRIICCSEWSTMIRWELIVPLLISHEVFVDTRIPWKWCPLTLMVGRKCSIYRFERHGNNRVFHLRSEDTTIWFYRCKFIKEVSFALLSTVRALKSFSASFRPDSRTEKCQKNWRYVLVQGSTFERNHSGGRVSSSEYQSESIYG